MQVTTNYVALPSHVIDAYLEALGASVAPLLKENDMPSKAMNNLLWSAARATEKSICRKFAKEIEEAGLFKDVVSIDFPGFRWTPALKYSYAVEMLVPCMVYSIAMEMPENKRDLAFYRDYLDVHHDVAVDNLVASNLEGADGPAARRLEEHALGLADVNIRLLVGETAANILRLLNNVRNAMNEDTDTPLDNVKADMDYILPSPVVYL